MPAMVSALFLWNKVRANRPQFGIDALVSNFPVLSPMRFGGRARAVGERAIRIGHWRPAARTEDFRAKQFSVEKKQREIASRH
jgi:hypothetical protein